MLCYRRLLDITVGFFLFFASFCLKLSSWVALFLKTEHLGVPKLCLGETGHWTSEIAGKKRDIWASRSCAWGKRDIWASRSCAWGKRDIWASRSCAWGKRDIWASRSCAWGKRDIWASRSCAWGKRDIWASRSCACGKRDRLPENGTYGHISLAHQTIQ
ncbi:hypothetical protein AVEN_59771-1 [Araneus ventricosus]|uniref:Uncharacterized protein n=1 Tax=Araneus ventricosus TaxID=182803 RepID=A0A4Y2PBF7_ARAVE|nr:hypothetical protein AVEN_59771-1 [Araneus ventricosus]